MSRPIEVLGLQSWVTETKLTPRFSNSDNKRAKSSNDRLSRSNLYTTRAALTCCDYSEYVTRSEERDLAFASPRWQLEHGPDTRAAGPNSGKPNHLRQGVSQETPCSLRIDVTGSLSADLSAGPESETTAQRSSKTIPGTDFRAGSWIFTCIATERDISKAISRAAGNTSEGHQTPAIKQIAAPTLSAPTKYIASGGSPVLRKNPVSI